MACKTLKIIRKTLAKRQEHKLIKKIDSIVVIGVF